MRLRCVYCLFGFYCNLLHCCGFVCCCLLFLFCFLFVVFKAGDLLRCVVCYWVCGVCWVLVWLACWLLFVTWVVLFAGCFVYFSLICFVDSWCLLVFCYIVAYLWLVWGWCLVVCFVCSFVCWLLFVWLITGLFSVVLLVLVVFFSWFVDIVFCMFGLLDVCLHDDCFGLLFLEFVLMLVLGVLAVVMVFVWIGDSCVRGFVLIRCLVVWFCLLLVCVFDCGVLLLCFAVLIVLICVLFLIG